MFHTNNVNTKMAVANSEIGQLARQQVQWIILYRQRDNNNSGNFFLAEYHIIREGYWVLEQNTFE